ELLVHISPDIPDDLAGDPVRLGQVLTNIINNAVKFTERGEIRVDIAQAERTGRKVQLKLSVIDTGIGMTPEQSARLFQPFTQADMSTTRKHGGTGLGLTICRRLVELMGGRIWLESQPGVGTTFYFTVWLGIGDEKGTRTIVPDRLTRLRVLVVDDNAAAREILREPLVTMVSRVDVVASGEDALTAVRRQDAFAPYDVIFMDWRMPGMDGLQVSRQIKSDETLRHSPAIVLVTAFGREEARDEAERLQLEGFLVKPVTRSMIVDTLVSVFADSTSETHSSTQRQPATLSGARFLLVEDNEINQQIAVELLEGADATVTVANNGREAIEILADGPQPPAFDVVLMDLQMPDMDGYQATAALRANPRFATLPIVAMTAHATIDERQRCLAAGMNDHVAKPIDPAMLFETVRRFYKPAADAAPAAADAVPRPLRRADVDNDMPAIAGLDTNDGLSRVSRNRALYLKLLRQFVEQHAAVEQISGAIAAGDVVLAERLAHTLKGVAGNIGARPVHSAAGELEKLLRHRAAGHEIETAVRRLAVVLVPLVASLRTALPPVTSAVGEESAHTATAPTLAQSREAGARLTTLLSELDPGAAEFVRANHAALRPLFAGGTWPTFEQLVDGYAFADAQAQLEEALKTFTAA
ncbi:MAG TPA: response regulator, partial [Vicinamibacterales bacterium]|nr:response regulator [Vicinamibacterales bacterium]